MLYSNFYPLIGEYEKRENYDTVDGTGVRDYIHVVDLAIGHVASLDKLKENPGLVIYNLGTGNGTSVLEMVKAFEETNKIKIPYIIKDRRPGDVASCYADCSKANKELKWKADKSLIGQVDKQNMTVHRWFANKACPGDYLYNKHSYIAEQVNKKLGTAPLSPKKSLDDWAKEVIAGKHGNGHINREKSLKKSGCNYSYTKVRARVNELIK